MVKPEPIVGYPDFIVGDSRPSLLMFPGRHYGFTIKSSKGTPTTKASCSKCSYKALRGVVGVHFGVVAVYRPSLCIYH